MIQTDLNDLWDRWTQSSDDADGLLCRRGRQHDILVDLRDSRIWSRPHETGIWTEAMPLVATSTVPSGRSRVGQERVASTSGGPSA